MIMTIYIELYMHILLAYIEKIGCTSTELNEFRVSTQKHAELGSLRASEWVKLRVVPCMTNRILNF